MKKEGKTLLDFIVKYWVQWACGIIATGVVFFAKHYVKLQKKALEDKWKDKEKNMCSKIITTLEAEICEVEKASKEEDEKIHHELNNVHQDLGVVSSGVLSIQGKQFRDSCERLLEPDHYITVDEYEEFETEYEVYKGLGGNHRGDALHDRVVDKFQAQMRNNNLSFE